MTCYIFLGPSLPRATASAELDAIYLPPVCQGDILRLVLQAKPRAIGIIDGCFADTPACWHKEILYALTKGVHVFGGASMGALRAAELDAFGMVGVGLIYEAYRSGRFPGWPDDAFEADDEVAILHGPAELGYPPLCEALVTIRATLAEAAAQGVISPMLKERLLPLAKAIFYPERSFARLIELARHQKNIRESELAALTAWLPQGRIDVKHIDGLATLAALRAFLITDPPPMAVRFRLEESTAWHRAMADALAVPMSSAPDLSLEELVLDEALLSPELAPTLRSHAVERLCTLDAAYRDTASPGAEAVRAASHAFRQKYGLLRQRAFEAWLAGIDLDLPAFERLMGEEIRLAALTEKLAAAASPYMLDLLRLWGNYAGLRQQAIVKHQALGSVSLPDLDEDGVMMRKLISWHAALDERQSPPNLDCYARSLGFCDGRDLFRALWREWVWRQREAKVGSNETGDHGSA